MAYREVSRMRVEEVRSAVARLAPYEAQVGRWLRDEYLKLTRIQELLG